MRFFFVYCYLCLFAAYASAADVSTLDQRLNDTILNVTSLQDALAAASASWASESASMKASITALSKQLAALAASQQDGVAIATFNSTTITDASVAVPVMLWHVFGTAFLVLMIAGYSVMEIGAVRSVNALGVVMKNLCIFAITSLFWWALGFGFAFGYKDNSRANGFIGNGSIFLVSDGKFPGGKGYHYGHWVYHSMLATLTIIVASTALAERTRIIVYPLFAFFMAIWNYPIIVHWVWGRSGWLSPGNARFNLGDNGMLDFAGSGVVHLVAGSTALVATWCVGPRAGKALPKYSNWYIGNNKVYRLVGTLLVFCGYFGLNAANTTIIARPADTGDVLTRVAANTIFGASSSAAVGFILAMFTHRCFFAPMVMNSFLTGLAALSAPCGFVEPWAAVVIGALAAFAYWGATGVLTRSYIDDPLDVIAIHGAGGAWGCLSVGLFASKPNTQLVLGRKVAQYGWIYLGGLQQFGVQFVGIVCIAGWSLFMGLLLFWFVQKMLTRWFNGGLRVEKDMEESGTDEFYFGWGLAYGELAQDAALHARVGPGDLPVPPKHVLFDRSPPSPAAHV